MTYFEKSLDFPARSPSGAHRLPILAAIKTAVLLALLIAYSLGFAALCPLAQTSAAKSAAEGNVPVLLMSP